MTYFLFLSGDLVIYFNEVITHSTDGIKLFRSGVDEFIKEGYIRYYPVRENGVIVRQETEIFEKKRPDEQKVNIVKDYEEEERLLNTHKTSTYASKCSSNYNSFDKITREWNLLTNVIPIEIIISNINGLFILISLQ